MRWGRSIRFTGVIVFSAALAMGVSLPPGAGARAADREGEHLRTDVALTFSDEFDGPAGAAPNPSFWRYDTGGGGWGNNEKQVYTDSRDNSRLDGSGHLVVEARRNGTGFTSARLVTKGRFDFTYGTVEARIKVPAGKGIHPGFWGLGANIDTVGWPECGEIDALEVIGDGSQYHVGVHGPRSGAGSVAGGQWSRSAAGSIGANLSAGFHNYAVAKSPGSISMSIDGNVVQTVSKSDLGARERWVFDAPTYLLLNVAVGGDWPGPVDGTTPFPATMLVDWVRYSQ
ncbi:glycoside hydrolase family 16 protein [Rhodococcus sp. ABRD24]|uniref:glycoside hydrolase family 16 protein n=1 Tax=Rhodococcus sp. ABRD24 TaxID=2507582 RepID=UPI00103E57D7|nr:glycoside hydrolase family 16 protein [Rhodococcus sp. ABRD24]QBJ97639.1 glycoside hydrolase family 16 protein [Rhodococcus sp. ABRD24]